MQLSVIIPCYNAEPWLCRCLDSVIGQGFDDMEIICVNDGSSDATLSILRDYEARYPALVRVIDKPNGGVSSARNAGIDTAQGRWLTFVDADDIVPSQIYGAMFDIGSCVESDLKVGTFIDLYKDGTSKITKYDDKYRSVREFYIDNIESMSPCGKFYKRELIIKHNLRFDESVKWCEDAIFNLEFSEISSSVNIVNLQSYIYCHRDGSAIGKFYGKQVVEWIEKIRQLRDKLIGAENKDIRIWIERDAAFSYMMSLYALYRSRNIADRYDKLKFIWRSGERNDSNWIRHFDSGMPKFFAKIGSCSIPLLHLTMRTIFAVEKILKGRS